MLTLLLIVLVLLVAGYVAWPQLTGRPRPGSIGRPVRALLTLDETMARVEQTVAHTDGTLAEVREVMVELTTVIRRLDTSLGQLDHTMAGVGEVAASVDDVARRAVPLLATLEKVVTPMTAAGKAARLVRRPSGNSAKREPAASVDPAEDEQDLNAYEADFGSDETIVLAPIR